MRRLAPKERLADARPLQTEDDANEGRLPSTVGSRNGNELALTERKIHVLEDRAAEAVRERDVLELDG